MKATIAGRRKQRALHGTVSLADLVVVVGDARWPRAINRTVIRVSENFPIIVIIMLCDESRRIR
eukprot:1450260-Prymnesium_polylepis.1